MREIKFRAWDKVCNEWLKDNWRLYLNGGVSIDEVWATKDIILMQYTGRTDKKGKEVYEGDIDKYDGKIRWSEIDLAFVTDIRLLSKVVEIEIIGNIYENP